MKQRCGKRVTDSEWQTLRCQRLNTDKLEHTHAGPHRWVGRRRLGEPKIVEWTVTEMPIGEQTVIERKETP